MSTCPIVEVCVYREDIVHHGFRRNYSQGHGAEVTRQVTFVPETCGTQTITIPIEQDDVDIATIKVIPTKTEFAVVDIATSSQPESFDSKIGRFQRASSLYAEFKQMLRSETMLRQCLKRWQSLATQLERMPDICRKLDYALSEQLLPVDHINNLVNDQSRFVRPIRLVHRETAKVTKELESVSARLEKCRKELQDMNGNGLRVPHQLTSGPGKNDNPLEVFEALHTVLHSHKENVQQISIVVTADVSRVEPSDFLLRYSTRGSYWTAVYDLKVKSDDLSVLEVFYYSRIQQHTNEDWNDVELTLSTGKLSTTGAPPHLGVSVVRPEAPKVVARQHAPRHMLRAAPPGAMAKAGLFGAAQPCAMSVESSADMMGFTAFDGPCVEMLAASPLETATTQAAYKIGGTVSVMADTASPTQSLISKLQIPMRTIFYCAPEVDTNVYRASRLVNNTDYHLVESAACSIFWDGSYTASTRMPCVAPGDSFNLFLGQSEKVQVKVNPPKHWIKNGGGLLNQNDRLYYERSVTISSFEPGPVLMFLAFNLIEARDDEIKVSLDKISSVIEISAADDISILNSPSFPTTEKPLRWIYNPITRNCIALVIIKPDSKETVTFATIIESPNGRVINIQPIPNPSTCS